jgi:hypothetical protein
MEKAQLPQHRDLSPPGERTTDHDGAQVGRSPLPGGVGGDGALSVIEYHYGSVRWAVRRTRGEQVRTGFIHPEPWLRAAPTHREMIALEDADSCRSCADHPLAGGSGVSRHGTRVATVAPYVPGRAAFRPPAALGLLNNRRLRCSRGCGMAQTIWFVPGYRPSSNRPPCDTTPRDRGEAQLRRGRGAGRRCGAPRSSGTAGPRRRFSRTRGKRRGARAARSGRRPA